MRSVIIKMITAAVTALFVETLKTFIRIVLQLGKIPTIKFGFATNVHKAIHPVGNELAKLRIAC